MNKLFDYGLFIDSQNLSMNKGSSTPWEYQEHVPAHFSKEALCIAEPYSKECSSHLSNWCAYAYDLLEAQKAAELRGELFHSEYIGRREELHRVFRERLKANLRPTAKLWRFRNQGYYFPRKAQLREWGEVVKLTLAGAYDVAGFLEEVRGQNTDVAGRIYNLLDGEDCIDDVVVVCSDCGAYHDRDNSSYTVDGEPLCQSCTEDNYTYSSCMDGYISNGSAYQVYDSERSWERGSPDDHCTRRYGNNNFESYDGSFFSDPDDMPYDDEDEDEDEGDGDYLDGYHGAERNFREINGTPGVAALGVELEVYAKDRRDAVESVKDYDSDLICERDGSLDEAYGFEIVTKPFGPKEWAEMAPGLLTTLRSAGAVGYQAPSGYLYGIHVNIHRRHFSPLAEARIMMLLCDKKNRNFVKAIAQREGIYSADIDIGYMTSPSVRDTCNGKSGLTECYHDGKYVRKIKSAGKYCPVNWQDNIAEFRIFNSTLNEVSFMKNLEFVWALCAWTKPQAATGSSTCHKDFIQWVASPQQRAQYPNLINYLSRKAFFTKGGNRIENTWLSLLNKPSDQDTSELLLAA